MSPTGGMPDVGRLGGMWSMSGPMWMPSEPPTLARLFAWHPQPVPLLPLCGLLALLAYVAGVLVASRRGSSWPWGRTLSWVAAVALVEITTATGIEGYGMMMFSVHMAQHLVLAMIVPVFLVLGAPVALARLSLPTTGRGVILRRALDRTGAGRTAASLRSLPVRWGVFLGSLYGVYFTPLFGQLMHTYWTHALLLAWFVAAGCLFLAPLVSPIVPATRRLAEAFASTPVHAAFGLVILLAPHQVVHFFDHPAPEWGVEPRADQSLAGGLAWATSEAVTVIVMVVIVAQLVLGLRGRVRPAPNSASPGGSAVDSRRSTVVLPAPFADLHWRPVGRSR